MNGFAPRIACRQLNVVVTGGSRGCGRALVEAFAHAGHRVLFTFLHSRDLAAELEARLKGVTMARLDQGDIHSVAAFAIAVREWSGGAVDVLVNNAALGSATVTHYVDNARSHDAVAKDAVAQPDIVRRAAEDEALMRVNALGPLWVTDALMDFVRCAADKQSRRGYATVIFIGSVGGGSSAVFPEYRPADLMSKAGMTYLSKHLAAEHVRGKVDIVCISPGATETEMFRESTLSKVANVEQFVDSMPKRRLIQPSDVAASILWLATEPAARIFHGAVLDASLGLAVRPGLQTESKR